MRTAATANERTAGAVYVFARSNGVWAQQAYVKSFNIGMFDLFGVRMALSRDATCWRRARRTSPAAEGESTYLKAPNSDAYDQFGGGVAIGGDGSSQVRILSSRPIKGRIPSGVRPFVFLPAGGGGLAWPRGHHHVKHQAEHAPCSGQGQGQRAHEQGAEDEWVHEECIGRSPARISGASDRSYPSAFRSANSGSPPRDRCLTILTNARTGA